MFQINRETGIMLVLSWFGLRKPYISPEEHLLLLSSISLKMLPFSHHFNSVPLVLIHYLDQIVKRNTLFERQPLPLNWRSIWVCLFLVLVADLCLCELMDSFNFSPTTRYLLILQLQTWSHSSAQPYTHYSSIFDPRKLHQLPKTNCQTSTCLHAFVYQCPHLYHRRIDTFECDMI